MLVERLNACYEVRTNTNYDFMSLDYIAMKAIFQDHLYDFKKGHGAILFFYATLDNVRNDRIMLNESIYRFGPCYESVVRF